MLQYLGLTSEYPSLKIAADIIYYSFISIAIFSALILVYKRLIALGYNKKKVMRFTILCAAVTFPAAYAGTRVAAIFFKPIAAWTLDLLLETVLSGKSHTFHAGLALTAICISALVVIMRFKYSESMDAIFLYVPLGHAIGRVACLIIGCCWGRYVTFNFFGMHAGFPNPVPLYSIIVNIFIFLFLRRIYEHTYSNQEARKIYSGSVFASYFLLYGAARLTLEIFRTERRIGFGLTQAQAVMAIFIITGIIVFLVVRRRFQREGIEDHTRAAAHSGLRKLFLLEGFLVSYLVLFFVFFFLTRKARVLPWPFQKVETVSAAYANILFYFPMNIIPALSLYWLEKTGASIREKFRWGRFSGIFFIGLAFSIFYTVYLLVLKEPVLRGFAFWPPVIVLSLMNAVFEEITFRFAAFTIFRQADYSTLTSNIAQSLLYSLIHFIIGGPVLGVFSLLYGFILCIVMERYGSIIPCIICHFAIDIGCIGLPMLS